MSATAYKALCARLLQVDITQRIDVCCLCLEKVGDYGIAVEDEIELGHHLKSTKMSSIIKSLTDESFSEVMHILPSVCKNCTSSSIHAYKFIQDCIENSKLLRIAVGHLEKSFQDVKQDTVCKTLFVAIQANKNPNNSVIERYYDKKRLVVPQDTAFHRFMMIFDNDNSQETDEVITENKTPEIKLSEAERYLLCCKVNFDTRELLCDRDNISEYRCKFCKELFTGGTSLRTHFYRVHRKKNIKCDGCSKPHQTSALTETKAAGCFQKSPLRTQENETSASVQSDADYDSNHSEIENENGRLLLREFITFKESSELNTNLKDTDSEIAKQKIFRCKDCDVTYTHYYRYKKHIQARRKCTDRRRGTYICDICGHHALYKHLLARHMRFKHLGEKGYVCSYCNRNCMTKNHLTEHLRTHTKEKPFLCPVCGRGFANSSNLKSHTTMHTGERAFPCLYCDKTFRHGTARNEHVNRHHKPGSYKCDICNFNFKVKGDLKKHREKHFNPKSKIYLYKTKKDVRNAVDLETLPSYDQFPC